MKDIFIIGSKGIPANYGGFETFVHKLVEKKQNNNINYYVSCLSDNNKEFIFNDAKCFNVKVGEIGSAKAVLYDIKSLIRCVQIIKKNNIKDPIIYILACRMGPFLLLYRRILKGLGVKILVNPDGHEWKRSKWNALIKLYWKISERFMLKAADHIVCDSLGIEEYVKNEYKEYNPKTSFIAYGADVLTNNNPGEEKNDELDKWYEKFNIKKNNYYLICGRFVPENNYEVMIKEHMLSKTKKDLVIITNVEENKFYTSLLSKTQFQLDNRIKFVGTVYNEELLKLIRENAFAYLHGHEVGGTNPSLLEALASTNLNILYDVNFNREVAQDTALYFNKDDENLASIVNKLENISQEEVLKLGVKAKQRIIDHYSWELIVNKYESLFMEN